MDDAAVERLVGEAARAQENAYCPYSKYKVGCAVVTAGGRVYRGANMENASYPLGVCAERGALQSAVSAGERSFVGLAVVTRDGGVACGACRQVIKEFLPPDATLVFARDDGKGERVVTTLNEILPHSFGPENLLFGDDMPAHARGFVAKL